MTIAEVIERRAITEVLHFTTHQGLTGILDSQSVKSRERVSKDHRLDYILKNNSSFRKDSAWLDYVNLSISSINRSFYAICSKKWHPEVSWRIISFSPEILLADGVIFSTTNNIYTSTVRGAGPEGLERLFAREVCRWPGNTVVRDLTKDDSHPTDEQAEVLYPVELSTRFVQCIYVLTEEDADDVQGLLAAVRHPPVDVTIDPTKFNGGHNGE